MVEKRDNRTTILAVIILFLVSFGIYANTLSNGFVYDDDKQIIENPWIRDIRNLDDIFARDVWGFYWREHGSSNYYRPMMHVMYLIVYHTAGLSPWAFHLMNILFHSATSILIFFLITLLIRNSGERFLPGIPFMSALLFASHPIHTEVVAWAAGIPDLSFTFFCLSSFYLFIQSTNKKTSSPLLFILSIVTYVVALLSKEPAVTLPLILFFYDYSFRRDTLRTNLYKYLIYLFVTAIYFAVRIYALGGITYSESSVHFLKWIPDVFPLFVKYIQKLIFPVNLNAYYSFSPAASFNPIKVIIGMIVTIAFIASLFISLRKSRVVFLSLVFISVPLLPALYLPGIGEESFAERYLYMPSFGYVILLSLFISLITERFRRSKFLFLTAGIIIVLLYSSGTIARNQVWKDDYSLWSDTVVKSPNSHQPHNMLGRAYFKRGEIDKAIKEYRIALRLKPKHPETHNNLGAALATKNLVQEAEQQFLTALDLKPYYSDAHNNIGILYGSQGQLDKAIAHFKEAIRSRPDFADAHHNLGVTYLNKGMVDLAIKEFRETLRLDPDAVNAHLNLARAYEMKGLAEEARKHRLRARELVGKE